MLTAEALQDYRGFLTGARAKAWYIGGVSKKRISILSTEDTRGWHSPFSREMRELRRGKIIARCLSEARSRGLSKLDIYDAFETLVYSGKVA